MEGVGVPHGSVGRWVTQQAGRERGSPPKGWVAGSRSWRLGEVLKLPDSCHLATAGLVNGRCHTPTCRAERHSAVTHSCSVLLCADKGAS